MAENTTCQLTIRAHYQPDIGSTIDCAVWTVFLGRSQLDQLILPDS